jgi:hypothetical protein
MPTLDILTLAIIFTIFISMGFILYFVYKPGFQKRRWRFYITVITIYLAIMMGLKVTQVLGKISHVIFVNSIGCLGILFLIPLLLYFISKKYSEYQNWIIDAIYKRAVEKKNKDKKM